MRWLRVVLWIAPAMAAVAGCSWYDAVSRKFGINAYTQADQKSMSRTEAEKEEAREPD